jgi:phosphatidylglycerol---prolipoprotein diacylglyceryl transferase
MYPNLSYLLHDWFGTPVDNIFSVVQMFGLLLGISFFLGGYVLFSELRRYKSLGLLQPKIRKETIGAAPTILELAANAFTGFVFGFKGVYLFQHQAEIADPLAFLPTSQGNWLWGGILAFALGAWRWWEVKRRQLPEPKTIEVAVWPHQRVTDFVMVAAIFGLLGAKLFASLESPEYFADLLKDPIGTLFSGSGLTFYGGLICGTAGMIWFTLRMGVPLRVMLDACAPAILMGYAIGRIGCQLSGDGDWGIAAGPQPAWWFLPDWAWAYDYPHNVSNYTDAAGRAFHSDNVSIIEGFTGKYNTRLDPKVYPTPLWETTICLAIFALLWMIRKRTKPAGMLLCIYLFFNGLERYWIEKVRVNVKLGGGFTQAEWIAMALMALGIFGAIYLWFENRRSAVADAPNDISTIEEV